jgi:hypothetical protein
MAGARVGDATSLGVNGLHMAAQEGNAGVADVLIRGGAPPDTRDAAGWSALHYAANHRWASWRGASVAGQVATVELLAAARAHGGAADDEGATSMHAAAHAGRPELCAALRAAGAPAATPAGTYVRRARTPTHTHAHPRTRHAKRRSACTRVTRALL